MAHRQLFTSPASEVSHIHMWNHHIPDPHICSENVPTPLLSGSIGATGVNFMTYANNRQRVDGYMALSFSSGSLHNDAALGTSHPVFMHASTAGCSNQRPPNYWFSSGSLHYTAALGTSHQVSMRASSAGYSSQLPPNYWQHGNSYGNVYSSGYNRPGNPPMYNDRVGFKRKSPATPLGFDNGSTSGYYSGGNFLGGQSSAVSVHSHHLPVNSVTAPQSGPWNLMNCTPLYRNDDLPAVREEYQRNVRRRPNRPLHHEVNPVRAYPSSTASTGIVTGLGMSGRVNLGPVSLPAHLMVSSAGSNIINSNEISGPYYTTAVQSRNPALIVPTYYVPATVGTGAGGSGHSRRPISYGASSSYSTIGLAPIPLEQRALSRVEVGGPSQHSGLLPSLGRGSDRNDRLMNSQDRFRFSASERNITGRWISEGVTTSDRVYDLWNLFDRHRDLRLDIDDLSYEDLLDLGESIGNVGTGFSEDTISKCLAEGTYCSSDQIQDDQQEEKCVICMEEYQDGGNLGRLNCKHEFHSSCIKKWLQIKNVCPICKATAVKDTSKETQRASL